MALRIVHVLERLPCGGVGTVVNLLHRGALAAGHESRVITGGRAESWREWSAYAADWDEDLGLPREESVFWNGRYGRRLCAALEARLLDRRPDVIHLHQVATLIRLAPVLERLRIPCVLTVHGMVPRYTAPGWVRWWSRHAFRNALTRTRCRCLSVSASSARQIEEGLGLPSGRVTVQRNPVDLVRFSPGPASDSPPRTILMVSRLVRMKRIQTGLRALSLLDSTPAFRMRIAGEGPMRQELEALAGSLSIRGRVSLLGACRDVPALLREAGVLWLLSKSEGGPMAALEAMASGVPVVATDVPGCSDLVRHEANGLLVPLGDAPAAAAATRRLWADPALRARLIEGGFRTIGEYRLEQVLPATLEHYRQALASYA